jgi:hypothetical protein
MRFSFFNLLPIRARYCVSFVTVRPIRKLFFKMIINSDLRLLPEKCEWGNSWRLPNVHWWLLYKTVFKFFKWVHYDGWRPFCTRTGGRRQTFLPIARFVKWLGDSTAGYAISGGRCFHCNHEDGCQLSISDCVDARGYSPFVRNVETWTVGTMDGTDYRFSCTTVCPKCGYKSYFEDGSL